MIILIAAAVIPAIMLLNYIRKADRLEAEPPALIRRLVLLGLGATVLAALTESLGSAFLSYVFSEGTLIHDLLMYFIVVAVSEEGFKYLLMKKAPWNHPAFNCVFDGVVYAVAISLGFALWENIGYVMQFGFGTAIVRAVTAVPGHASFGVFMGALYGAAKRASLYGDEVTSKKLRSQAVLLPVILHGLYDFIATGESGVYLVLFFVFIWLLFKKAKQTVKNLSENDAYF
ncbi:MAG: PrsW family intramembrane metalloprotease [Lachnospiraceae bacterium]|nr:PrsW family intramembrane metalloprotease [Lachnospiraceae bacterium]